LSVLAFAAVMSRMAMADSVVADKVVIKNTGAIPAFHISEVEVFEQGSATNVAAAAAGASATASSTGWGTDPNWAIDGNADGAFGSNSIWHDSDGQEGDDPTQADELTIVFGSPKTVDLFSLWGRTDCCTDRDDSILVSFYNGTDLVGQNATGIIDNGTTGRVAISAIPEPSTAVLLLVGSALVSGRWRRRRG
jgi:hypothetical protein